MTLAFILFGFAIIAVGVFIYTQEKKRREAMAALALRLGMRFSPEADHALPEQFHFLNNFNLGDNRYAYNVMKGMFQGVELTVFEYHYETHSYSSKGRRTQHHYVSMLTMGLPKIFPKLMIAPEGIFSKIAQALGFEDIDFESHEFSRSFCVRSGDKKFAYDVCHARLIEYLLQNKDLRIEINRNVMALSFDGRLNIEKIEGDMGRLLKVRAFLPEYLLIKEPV